MKNCQRTLSTIVIGMLLLLALVVPAFGMAIIEEKFDTDNYELAITNFVSQTKETVTIDMEEKEYNVYLIAEGARLTITPKVGVSTGVSGVNKEQDGNYYSDPWPWKSDANDFRPYVEANVTAYVDLANCDYYKFFVSNGDDKVVFLLKNYEEQVSREETAGDLNHELYDLDITNYVETVQETLQLEGRDAKEYDVYVVEKNSVLSFTPKKSVYATVSDINLEEGYMAPQLWTIDGSQELVNYVDSNMTATCELGKYEYYSFSVDDDAGFEREIIIKVVDKSTPGEADTEESTPVLFDADDAPTAWAKADVETAISKGIIPSDMHNKYKQDITREDFCKTIVKLVEVKTGKSIDQVLEEKGKRSNEQKPFKDTDKKYILDAYQLKIINGRGQGIFDPSGNITRQEAAVMLTNAARVLNADLAGKGTEFEDNSQVANWASSSVEYVSAKGIMGGVGSNNFSPKTTYTRQQSYITLLRLLNTLQ